jgi:hypothetical protein
MIITTKDQFATQNPEHTARLAALARTIEHSFHEATGQ